ncbi:hypothetical protein CH063_00988 [Colletotrichum higginsianum]|uniref:Uncharacterized protein n=1 Tax=Colletotrichum higginsianum (strain IMI 349063) TaxID=759273 RepID=H1UZW3_COLHI|nr:hypothetical protein CH063_00988 [Colletotrichum higginsianum]
MPNPGGFPLEAIVPCHGDASDKLVEPSQFTELAISWLNLGPVTREGNLGNGDFTTLLSHVAREVRMMSTSFALHL